MLCHIHENQFRKTLIWYSNKTFFTMKWNSLSEGHRRQCTSLKTYQCSWSRDQDPANNLTPLRYSSKARRFGNYLCMNLWKSKPSYLTCVQVKYFASTTNLESGPRFADIWQRLNIYLFYCPKDLTNSD